jgi:polyhydroxybutyrate depolymerase
VRVLRWGPGRAGAEVVFVRVEGGGHTWPGGERRNAGFGRRSTDVDVTRMIWDFFSRQSRRVGG